jgi:hypothetical protein
MKASRQPLSTAQSQSRSPILKSVRTKIAVGLGVGLTLVGLMGTPAFGQAIEPEINSEIVTKSVTEPIHASTQTALLNPVLDELLSSFLLWTVYLGLPLTLTIAIWNYDQRARESMAELVQHTAMLERIWQSSSSR